MKKYLTILISLVFAAMTLAETPTPSPTKKYALQWNASPSGDIDGYRIYYGNKPNSKTSHLDVGKDATTAILNLPITKEPYYFTVVAYKGTTESMASNEVAK